MKVTIKGEELEVVGTQPKVGDQAPSFSLPNLNGELVHLSDFVGKAVLVSVVPDIDTSVCAIQTKHFNQEAAKVPAAKLITISNNTKEEQAKWCAAEGVDMEMLHDTQLTFGKAYGLYIPKINHLARSIFVIDSTGKIVHEEIVAEITHEPDYKTALEKLLAL